MLPAVPLFFRDGADQTFLNANWRDFRKQRGQIEGSSEVSGRADGEELNLDALLETNLLWAEDEDVGDVAEKVLMTMGTLITAVGLEVSMSKKVYVELLRSLGTVVQSARRESGVAARKRADQVVKVE